jgi:GTPase Era involved in 16S rRNA processing
MYFLIFFFTRKKEIKTIAHLPATEPVIVDINAIRSKYLAIINDIVARFEAKKIKASEAHQELSLAVRRFYAEAYKFKAEFLTLSDLKKTNKKPLTETIEKYYPDEFDLLEKGSVADSAEIARRLINMEEVKNA